MRHLAITCVLILCLTAITHAADLNKLSDAEKKDGFVSLFDGKTLKGWVGSVDGYSVEDGAIVCSKGGNLYAEKPYANFVLRFDVLIPEGGNNGVGVRCVQGKDAAYNGMEIQVLDNKAKRYAKLKPTQYHGSVYKIAAAKRGFQKPAGEWNTQEIRADGPQITVTLNGTVITDVDLSTVKKGHKSLHNKSGSIGFLGHGSPVQFRNIRIKELP